MKLNQQNLHRLAAEVQLPGYNLSDTRQGIAHIGVGGFHRAHQAYYTDALMNTGEALDWAICGVGLRAEDRRARDDLKEQDYLFTLFELGDSDDTEVRVIGAIRDMLLAEDGAQALIDKLADPQIRIVSLTITEGVIASTTATANSWRTCRRFNMIWPIRTHRKPCSASCVRPWKNAGRRAFRRLP